MGQKVIIRFWWEFGLSSASRNHLTTFFQTFPPLRMFKIVFHAEPDERVGGPRTIFTREPQ